MPEARLLEIKKTDDELQIAYGEVLIPWVPDSQGDVISPLEIRKAAHRFMFLQRTKSADVNHDCKGLAPNDGIHEITIVESFIARPDDPIFIPEAWVVGAHVAEASVWGDVKNGKINGFSIEGGGLGFRRVMKVDLPDKITGKTFESDGHLHKFDVTFDSTGKFSGQTALESGHFHRIVKGTVTEAADGHTHRFALVDRMLGRAGS